MDYTLIIQSITRPPARLDSVDAVDQILTELRSVASEISSTVLPFVSALLDAQPGLFEAFITSPAQSSWNSVPQRLIDEFDELITPPHPVHRQSLERIGAFLLGLPPSITIGRHLPVIYQDMRKALAKIVADPLPDAHPGSKSGRKGKAKAKHEAKRPDAAKLPSESKRLAAEAAHDSTKKLKDVLEAYIAMSQTEEINHYALQRAVVDTPIPVDEAPEVPLDSYGDWRIVVGQRVIKHCRELYAGDPATAAIVERKLEELAAGIFSPTNYIRLLDDDHGVAIYKVRLNGDLRLLYQIDCSELKKGEGETQFIRVFGLYHINQIDKSFWTSVASELSRRGNSYRKKCSARAMPRVSGDYVTPPLTFGPADTIAITSVDKAPEDSSWDLDEEHFLELHRILALEKFIPFSRNFFNSIRDHAETSFVFKVSPQEDEIIAHDSSCLVLGRSGTGKTTTMLFRIIALEVASDHSGVRYRQLFVTQSRTLARRVQAYYHQLRSTSSHKIITHAEVAYQAYMSLRYADDEADDDNVLPERFSDLQDHHFPAFLTYDKLAKMLAADLGMEFLTSAPALPRRHNARALAAERQKRYPFVSFNFFVSEIWPHFSQGSRKDLHPALVFSEFLGVIKGSEAAMASPEGFLSRSTYEGSARGPSSVAEGDRVTVYDLFEQYRRKRPINSWDAADRTFALIGALSKVGRPGKAVDFLYVDEAQDNLISDVKMLRILCRNPHGLFFAGDTAQTISVGSAFRFSELKACLYRLEMSDPSVVRGARAPVQPAFFQLTINYRSHNGIVKAAAFIVSMLKQWFPKSIDTLAPESAIVSGPRPTFFSGREDSDEDFLRLVSDKSTGKTGLGAHQVIIVRDEAAAKRVRQLSTTRVGSVLTIYESKGMEYNDVFLYNFFTDSLSTPTNWRALLSSHSQSFDPRRHGILQSELKSLYVALTRAREHVWLWETSDKGWNMETHLRDLRLASSFPNSQPVPQLAVASSADEWAEQGHQLFNKKIYSEAEFCFDKAELPWWRDVSAAYAERLSANRMPTTQMTARRAALIQVAQEFQRLAKESPLDSDRPLLDLNAAECFAEGGQSYPAAQAFYRAARYTEAVWHYRIAGHLDDAIRVIKEKETEIEPDILESVKYAAKVDYTKTRRIENARDLCSTQDEYVEFLKDHAFESQHIQFLESVAQHEDLAKVLWQKGEHRNAVMHFLKSTHPDATQNATACWLEGVRREVHFGSDYATQTVTLKTLLMSRKYIQLSSAEQDEVELISRLASADAPWLATHAHRLSGLGDTRSALLAYDAWARLQPPRLLESADMDKAIGLLRVYLEYSRIIGQISRKTDIVDQPNSQLFFGLSAPRSQADSATTGGHILDDRLLVHASSVIHARACHAYPSSQSPASQSPLVPVLVSRQFANYHIQRVLFDKLNVILAGLDASAVRSGPFEVCARFATLGQCGAFERGTCWRDHPRPANLTLERYNERVRIHLLLIGSLDLYTATDFGAPGRGRRAMQGIWLAKFFETCYPANPQLGNIADIVPALIPEYQQTMGVLMAWCQEVFMGQRPSKGIDFFLSNILRSSMIATAMDYHSATKYLWHGQWNEDKTDARRNRLINEMGNSTVKSMLCWYAVNTGARHSHGYYFIKHVVDFAVAIDVIVLVSFIEEVAAQLILNHYHHEFMGLHGLTLPRSWIIRAVRRGPSIWPNGQIPFHLVAVLPQLLEILLGKRNSGNFHIRRAPLHEVLPLTLSSAIGRLCYVVALIGYNIPRAQGSILEVFRRFAGDADRPFSQPYQLYFKSQKWLDIVAALKVSTPQSSLCELVVILADFNRRTIQVQGIRVIPCPKAKDLQRKLMIGTHTSVLAISQDVINPTVSATSKALGPSGDDEVDIGDAEAEEDVGQMPSIENSDQCARVIQAFFRRTRTRFGGPVAAAFDHVAKTERNRDTVKSRLFVLIVRGPMPHVMASLQKLADRCQGVLKSLNRKMQAINPRKDYEALDKAREDGVEMRAVQKELADLAQTLQPKSALYEKKSFSAILHHIQRISSVTKELYAFDKEPTAKDKDYELGVGMMLRLVDRIAARRAKLEKKPKKPVLNAADVL